MRADLPLGYTGIYNVSTFLWFEQKFEKLRHVSHIQAHAWPAVLRGRDMVGVAPGEAGRSLAYVLPLITQLLQPSTYANLPPGNGVSHLITSPKNNGWYSQKVTNFSEWLNLEF